MGWLRIVPLGGDRPHRCALPGYTQVRARNAGQGSTYQCDTCFTTWRLENPHNLIGNGWSRLERHPQEMHSKENSP